VKDAYAMKEVMMNNPLEHYTDQELLNELQRRCGSASSDNTGKMATCGNCGAVLWPNQTHTCLTDMTTTALAAEIETGRSD